jgi:hypothetical protein
VCADVEKSESGGQQRRLGDEGILVPVVGDIFEDKPKEIVGSIINIPVVAKVKRRFTGKFMMPDMEVKPSSVYLIDNMQTIWKEKRNSAHVSHDALFNICKAHLPMDTSSVYYIVDMHGIVPDIGSHRLAIREFPYSEREKLVAQMQNMGWLPPGTDQRSVKLHKAEFMVSPIEFFRKNGDRWKEIVDMWVNENCVKDERLVDAFKCSQVPLLRGDSEYWQRLNSHAFLMTNTGTGKSTFSDIAGVTPIVDLSIPGIFGGNIGDYTKQQIGALQGSGFMLIDEIEMLQRQEYSSQIMLALLSYLESGKVQRRLKVPINCQGTKTIWFASNPSDEDDILYSFVRFLRILQGDADPKRLGRRIAFTLVGKSFRTVNVVNPVSSLRRLMPPIIHYSMLKYWDSKIVKIMKSNMRWVNDERKRYSDICHTLESKARACPNETVKEYISGMALGQHRIRFSAIRLLILENLEKICSGSGYRNAVQSIEENRENVYMRLVSHNMRSVDDLVMAIDSIQPTKECAQMILAKYPKASVRDIGLTIGVSHETVWRWFKNRDVSA